jgi:hypothetical protein
MSLSTLQNEILQKVLRIVNHVISFYLQKLRRDNQLITCDKWKFEGAENINEPLNLFKCGCYKTESNQFFNLIRFSFSETVCLATDLSCRAKRPQ